MDKHKKELTNHGNCAWKGNVEIRTILAWWKVMLMWHEFDVIVLDGAPNMYIHGIFWCDWWCCKEDTLKLKEFLTFYVYLHYEERNNHDVKLDYLSTQITTSK